MAWYADLSKDTNFLSSLVLSPSTALHWADIGDVLGNGGVVVVASVSTLSAALATVSSDGRNVVMNGVMVNVSSAARLVVVGFFMEKPWLQVVAA